MAVEIDGRMFDRRELVGGQILYTHTMDRCRGYCTVHNRSNHHMLLWPQNWRADRGIMEVICSHGIGHPDPDDISKDKTHGCDGCCFTQSKEVTDGREGTPMRAGISS